MPKKADEYLARTVVNLPYIEERYEPGSVIPRERFEAYVDEALAADPTQELTADAVIAELEKYGSISSDLDDELHPDHLPVDPSAVSVDSLVQAARQLVKDYEARGLEIPKELRSLAKLDVRNANGSDNGKGASNGS